MTSIGGTRGILGVQTIAYIGPNVCVASTCVGLSGIWGCLFPTMV